MLVSIGGPPIWHLGDEEKALEQVIDQFFGREPVHHFPWKVIRWKKSDRISDCSCLFAFHLCASNHPKNHGEEGSTPLKLLWLIHDQPPDVLVRCRYASYDMLAWYRNGQLQGFCQDL